MEVNGIPLKYALGIVVLIIFLIYYVTILWGKIDTLNNKLSKYEKGEKNLSEEDFTTPDKKESLTSRSSKKDKLKKLPEARFEPL